MKNHMLGLAAPTARTTLLPPVENQEKNAAPAAD
jgi:hypothetical protein